MQCNSQLKGQFVNLNTHTHTNSDSRLKSSRSNLYNLTTTKNTNKYAETIKMIPR